MEEKNETAAASATATPEPTETTAPEAKRPASGGFSRRTFALGVIGAVGLVAIGAGAKYVPSKTLLRPPGGQNEDTLVGTCLHCEKCREVCPQNVIAPTHIEDGLLNARTPSLDFKAGWCDFCADEPGGPQCLAVCPTHAIALPAGAVLGDPATGNPGTVILGKAHLNRDWCLAARAMGCHECVDACPFGALELGYDHVPVVDEDICNGCGACENACISMSAGALSADTTDRAITVSPL